MTKIVSIHSFRGGTGKSNIAANLAAQIALAGKRVGLIDTDIQSPGIHVLFGLDKNMTGHTLNQFLHGECGIEEIAYMVGEHAQEPDKGRSKLKDSYLAFVPSSIKPEEISRICRDGYDVEKLNEGIQKLRKLHKLDYLFIDTHPGINEETLLSIATTDILLVVLRPDSQDFQGTSVTVDIARDLGVPNMAIIINKALSRYFPEVYIKKVTDLYDTPVAGVLPMSEDMADLGSADIFTLCKPDHPWSKGIFDVVNYIQSL